MAWKLGRDSFHKMIVWFVDGKIITRYSIDWRHSLSKQRDPQIGFNRYYEKIHKWGERAATIEIYVNIYGTKNGALVEKYSKGIKKL